MADNTEGGSKRHAACDECRQRKLKCSGQQEGCKRCVKHKIQCHYSVQKQMGRPRKKQRTDDPANDVPSPSLNPIPRVEPPEYQQVQSSYPSFPDEFPLEPPIDPSLAAIDQDQTNFTNVCTGPIAQSIRDSSGPNVLEQQIAHYNQSNTGQSGADEVQIAPQIQYPIDIAQWPDFSTLESLPMPIQDSARNIQAYLSPSNTASVGDSAYQDPDANPAHLSALPSVPPCSCLPNLYLTLSTLSALSSFPVSSHTIQSLFSAQKTAHSVVYCIVCPQKFQSGSQNLMLSCTLFSVIADQWHRVRRCPVEDLRKGFSESTIEDSTFISVKEGQAWRTFIHNLIRAYVFGDKPIPTPPLSSAARSPTFPNPQTTSDFQDSNVQHNKNTNGNTRMVAKHYTLKFIIEALIRRQRQWHSFDEPTDEFPDRGTEGYPHTYSHQHHDGHKHNQALSSKTTGNPPGKPGASTSHTNGINNNSSNNIGGPSPGDDEPSNSAAENGAVQHEDPGDHALCILIARQSMCIVNSLDEEKI